VILPCLDEKFSYLTRGTGNLAFRIPDDDALRVFLCEAGPLIAPSANPQGETPAETISEAKRYFGNSIDFYIDGGTLRGEPSTIVRLENDRVTLIRPGAVPIEETIL
jgi:L-threonylcarbamoyladenylate synthase